MPPKFLQPVLNLVTKIRGQDYLDGLNRQMHDQGRFKGVTWQQSLGEFQHLVPESESKLILDFGCGPCGGLTAHAGLRVVAYDPYVKQYASSPWGQPLDVVFSSDVLEHMTNPGLFLARTADVLEEQGTLVISVPNAFSFNVLNMP